MHIFDAILIVGTVIIVVLVIEGYIKLWREIQEDDSQNNKKRQ